MWNDVETTQDLLNFKVVADTAAQMIKDGNGQPVSIGVSGSWGVGKSSLVQMIGESIKGLDGGKNYIFINFKMLGCIKATMTLAWRFSKKLPIK
jgi:pantothenate kinase-related protein Tda10